MSAKVGPESTGVVITDPKGLETVLEVGLKGAFFRVNRNDSQSRCLA